MNRRNFLQGSLAAAASFPLARVGRTQDDNDDSPSGAGSLVDTNVHLFRWPFRRLRGDSPEELAPLLRGHGVRRAWAGSFEAPLHKDVGGVNARLVRTCQETGDGLWVPIGTVNPRMPDWEEDLRRCAEEYRMPGIRLYPNYHRYELDERIVLDLLAGAADRQIIVQIPLVMEDPRTQHPFVQAPPVNVAPLADLIAKLPKLRVVIQNHRSEIHPDLLRKLAGTGQVYFDVARAEQVGSIEKLLEEIPSDRILFGSHAPFFYFEAAALKLQESELTEAQKTEVTHENANRLLQEVT